MDAQMLIGLGSMGGLGLILATLLAIADKKLRVVEDPRIDQVEGLLPGANCGACGLPGCRMLAENMVNDKVEPNACPVCAEEGVGEIAKLLGKIAEAGVKKVAKVLCRGGLMESEKKAVYSGIVDCKSAIAVGGGEKTCSYSCVGFGDCVGVCPFDAVWINKNGLPVIDEEKCTGCGKCVEVCPRVIIELHSKDILVHVYCRNQDKGKVARKLCKKACIACNICAKASPENIKMENNLAVINYADDFVGDESWTVKCPTDAIAYNLDPIH